MCDYGLSETEIQIICTQIKRRAKLREEFLRLRTDPCLNSLESGHVFDEAHQRFLAMKATQYDNFRPNPRNIISALLMVVLPMGTYGYFIWKQRTQFNIDCRCGKIRYKDRSFKLN